MKEDPDTEDPLSRRRSYATSTLFFSLGFVPSVNIVAIYELGTVLVLIFLSLFFSWLRAAYATAGAMENPWDRRDEEAELLPNEVQQLTLSVLQRACTLLGLILASRFAWNFFDDRHEPYIFWVAVACMVLWLWVDTVSRYVVSRNAIGFIAETAGISKVLFLLLKPLSKVVLEVSHFFGILDRPGSEVNMDRLEAKSESEEETDLLRGLANFRQTNARKAMQARVNITAFDIELNFHELMDRINKSGYSRVPVFRDDLDHVEGILNVKDLLPHIHNDEYYEWQKLLRPVYFIPESKRLDDLMKEFQNRRVHMAIVVDEYGGTSGLITLEDIIEEIFGDINDEYDDDDAINYTQVDGNTFVFEGKVHIGDLCRILNLEPDYFDEVRGNNESLAGLLLELFSRLPLTGEIATHRNITFKVQSADKRRIKKVRVLVT
ncbi:gliding motility-associated protein GldE [Dyadobacter jejuensis]|uniref:Gliding motility-associated protein GldE n=1 Tax=Dyadobacter jejuensis TaxID=1082580 RepID=A0A316ASJ8_9BACT|nr:transporter associated domain-containing protein [Dyadobacter jejuensis]PWJ60306.1 gliding motility-associated protein GldE [Dyadobacter jejuensis]